MSKDNVIDSLGRIDEDMIQGMEELRRIPRRSKWMPWVAIAVCLCMVIPCVFLINRPPVIITQHAGTDLGKYRYPEPGEAFCTVDVNDARAYYEGQNVKFMLSFYICKADGEDLSDEERIAEYQRLAELGYELYEVETWAYDGALEKVYYPVVVGLFSEKELAAFQPDPSYGYVFQFERNGDGSALSIDDTEQVTHFETEKIRID